MLQARVSGTFILVNQILKQNFYSGLLFPLGNLVILMEEYWLHNRVCQQFSMGEWNSFDQTKLCTDSSHLNSFINKVYLLNYILTLVTN